MAVAFETYDQKEAMLVKTRVCRPIEENGKSGREGNDVKRGGGEWAGGVKDDDSVSSRRERNEKRKKKRVGDVIG